MAFLMSSYLFLYQLFHAGSKGSMSKMTYIRMMKLPYETTCVNMYVKS